MSQALVWDLATEHIFETGVDHGVLYPIDPSDGSYPLGHAWNGLVTVTESPSGADATPLYADNIKYLNLIAAESFGGTIEAYTYPEEFGVCDGSVEPTPGLVFGQQDRKPFGLCFRTVLGNDAEGNSYGYKLHLIYGAVAAPSERAYATINDTPSAIAFSWAIKTTPVAVSTYKPVSSIVINSTQVDPTKLAALEAILYGSVDGDPRLPLPDEVITLLEEAAPSALTVDTDPADEEDDVAVASNVVLTFNNKISREAVVVTADTGVIVPVNRGWDTAHKILTLDPVGSLALSTTYIVTIAGVVDVYGQSLAAEVVNFTTVSGT